MAQDETQRGGRPRPHSHCVRWGPSSPSPKGAQPLPIFGPCLLWQTVGWIKMPLGTEVDLGPGDTVRWRHRSPQKGGTAGPNFRPFLLWPNGWMDPDATWCRGRPQPRRHCVVWGCSSTPKKGQSTPTFRPMSVVAKQLDESRCHLVHI